MGRAEVLTGKHQAECKITSNINNINEIRGYR
jgi:hypothetical protein